MNETKFLFFIIYNQFILVLYNSMLYDISYIII